jgi:hypothetical protein
MPSPSRVDPAATAHRTPSGEVILGSAQPSAAPTAGAGRALRRVAVALGVLAVLAAVTTGLAVAARSGGSGATGSPVPASSPAVPGSSSATSGGPGPTSPAIKPYPQASTVDPAGGLEGARARVAAFVAALNSADLDTANSLLCRSMFGHYDASSLDGIKPGSLGVGGVSVQGNVGSAIVTYLPDGGGPEQRSLFGLTVEHDAWMLCTPQ